MQETVTNESNDQKYFTQVCNFIEDLDISPLAFRLYFYYKRWANAEYKRPIGVKELSAKFKVGDRAIAKAKSELVTNKLIKIDESGRSKGIPDDVQILDVWRRNLDYFDKQTPRQITTRPLVNERRDPSLDNDAIRKKEREIKEEKHSPPNLSDALSIYQEVFPTTFLDGFRVQQFDESLPSVNADVWRTTLNEWKLNGYKSNNLVGLISRYKQNLTEIENQPKDKPKPEWQTDEAQAIIQANRDLFYSN